MNPVFLNVAIGLVTIIASSYSTVKILQYRAERSEAVGKELRTEYEASLKELRNFMVGINVSIERQLVIQKLTTDTLAQLNTKIEQTDKIVIGHTIEIAVLKEKERERPKHGRSGNENYYSRT